MGIIKGFTNLFIGEDDSDEVDFGQEFGSPKSSKGSSTKDGFFDDNDFSGSKSKSGARSKENDVFTERPFTFEESFARSKTGSESSFSTGTSSANRYEGEHTMSFDQTTTLQIVLARPVDFSEVRSIGDDINAYKTVILNLEMVKSDDAKRILDFLSGVAYANKAQIKMMAQKTFAIMSKNVKFDGKDLLTELENNGYSF
ncbi:cell division protein SepF [uncultured Ruminococcus sp.]|jgi:cell division inhibitor SepF|uniref:cell division protein SepF n=1 Tax=uncultured Ruminococcus sp. TaxID=165186 RepID=UPI0025DAEBD3|nr:cell division protein SepF [uncultured Ruminococcus sp.]MBE6867978.1 cell division protein SepF [Ruminococcus albus]